MESIRAQLVALADSPPPWWQPHLPALHALLRVAMAENAASMLNAAAARYPACPVRFVAQAELPQGEAYEAFIARTGTVPTRDNLHDVFNGLMWLGWPQTKQRLNQLQAEAIRSQGVSSVRGPMRDALTLFDENSALLAAPDELAQALQAREWSRLCVDLRAMWSQVQIVLFGHALLEKLLQPRKAITAHVWLVPSVNDVVVARSLTAERLLTKDFHPLPVLGVPGWWADNAQPAFYADTQVFRRARIQDA